MIFINIDFSDLDSLSDLGTKTEAAVQKAVADLAVAAKGKAIEFANQRLHTRRQPFIDALQHFQVDDNTWVVSLDASARWIDDGMSEHSMIEDLLKSKKAKRAKDGSMYVTVPFQLNKSKGQMTGAQQALLGAVKKALAGVGTTPNQIETNGQGQVKLGLVRSVDVNNAPKSTAAQKIGAGPLGQVAQGPTGIPLLRGVKVYQKEIPDGSGGKKVGRFVMTFRTASSKMGADRWRHPGLPAQNIMDDAMKWAQEEWDQKIGPAVMARLITSMK